MSLCDADLMYLYFVSLQVFGTANHFTFSVEQTNLVSNIQPAPVMAYDYYEKGRQAMPCLKATGHDIWI